MRIALYSHDTQRRERAQVRKYSRIQFDADARIEFAGQHYAARILDISLKGVLLDVSGAMPTPSDNQTFVLHIPLLDQVTSIQMQALLRHQEGQHIGCEWVGIDLDSMTSLRRLLELNLADNSLLERELAQLCLG